MDPSKSSPRFALMTAVHTQELGAAPSEKQILKIGQAILDGFDVKEKISQLFRLMDLITNKFKSEEDSLKNAQKLVYKWLLSLQAKGQTAQALLIAKIASDSDMLGNFIFRKALDLLNSLSSTTAASDFEFLIQQSQRTNEPQVKQSCYALFLELIFKWKENVKPENKIIDNLSAKWILQEPQVQNAIQLFDSQIEKGLHLSEQSKADLWLHYCKETAKRGDIKTLIQAWHIGTERFWKTALLTDMTDQIAGIVNVLLKSRAQNAFEFGLKLFEDYKSDLQDKVDCLWVDTASKNLLFAKIQKDFGSPDWKSLPSIIEKVLSKRDQKNKLENELLRRHIKDWIDKFCTSTPNSNWIASLNTILKNPRVQTLFGLDSLFIQEMSNEFASLCLHSAHLIFKQANDKVKKASTDELLMTTLKAAIESGSNSCLESVLELLEQLMKRQPKYQLSAELKNILVAQQLQWIKIFEQKSPASLLSFVVLLHQNDLQEKIESETLNSAFQTFLELTKNNPDLIESSLNDLKKLFATTCSRISETNLHNALEIIGFLLTNKRPDTAFELYEFIKLNKKIPVSVSQAIKSALPTWIGKMNSYNNLPINGFAILADSFEHFSDTRQQTVELIGKLPNGVIKRNLTQIFNMVDGQLKSTIVPNKKIRILIKKLLNEVSNQNSRPSPTTLSILLELMHHSKYLCHADWIHLLNMITVKTKDSKLQEKTWNYAKPLVYSYSPSNNEKNLINSFQDYTAVNFQNWMINFISTREQSYVTFLANYFLDASQALNKAPAHMKFNRFQHLYSVLHTFLYNVKVAINCEDLPSELVKALIAAYRQIAPFIEDPTNIDLPAHQFIKALLVECISSTTDPDLEYFKEGYKLISTLIKETDESMITPEKLNVSHLLFHLMFHSCLKLDDELITLAIDNSRYLHQHNFEISKYYEMIAAFLSTKKLELIRLAYTFAELCISKHGKKILEYEDKDHCLKVIFYSLLTFGISTADKEIMHKASILLQNDIVTTLIEDMRIIEKTREELDKQLDMQYLKNFHASINASIMSRDMTLIEKATVVLEQEIKILCMTSLEETLQDIKKLSLTPLYFKENNLTKLNFIDNLAVLLLKCLAAVPEAKHPDGVPAWNNMVQNYSVCFSSIPLPDNDEDLLTYMKSLSNFLDCLTHPFSEISSKLGNNKFLPLFEKSVLIVSRRLEEYSKRVTDKGTDTNSTQFFVQENCSNKLNKLINN